MYARTQLRCLPSEHTSYTACSEAVCLDPQARMLLEHTQELLSTPEALAWAPAVKTSCGMYVGCMYTGRGTGNRSYGGSGDGSREGDGRMQLPIPALHCVL